jgi:excisionase family DNA binding protein
MRADTPPAALLLAQGEIRLRERIAELIERIDGGDVSAWPEYLQALMALQALIPEDRRPLATTKEMAEKLGVTPKTVRRLGKAGKLEAVRLGKRGTGAIRWRA